ncbi:1,2-phenylacetyl-CoA epoxidase subunit PaaC [Azohydromonas caseinilytica]|uniref:Phenylacetate-CoA oxygenase subunit PaaC n=1 Tax=Azohydromonas caseinilytica TaxID=2728836 RepID=A0A848FET8_9BURK|nr:1,2-phenylacetyl-CoA epoxidase subunit PaaC [Azohydromonas caseinilytica]NML16660.1 phenylacetate-CoA oxygenase subunit PaaC [Azohydromonas caseinilytica]
MQASIQLQRDPRQQYLLRIGDTCLILAQRLGEWTGHAPVLEEDIALANMALDLLGQARAVLTLAGSAQGLDEDQLAFLREERDYFNPTLVELPNGDGRPGDFALTVLRNLFVSTLLRHLWVRLHDSSDEELSAIAAKAVKEASYHQQHAADWVLRLGDGTDESHRRMQAALEKLWPYVAELFEDDAVDEQAAADGLGPRWAELRANWHAEVAPLLQEATLQPPPDKSFMSTGKRGVHSEHMGYILAEMQHLQRAYPGGAW